jgi:hypothetical protein
MDSAMKQCPWDKIDAFRSFVEFQRFIEWMTHQVQEGEAEEVSVQLPYLGFRTLREQWFRHTKSGEVWRLVWPDPPFAGLFERVEGK